MRRTKASDTQTSTDLYSTAIKALYIDMQAAEQNMYLKILRIRHQDS